MDPEFQKRLLATYRIEAAEYLETMAAGLWALEEELGEPEREAILKKIYRDFHSLKGAARAVNEREVDSVCHRCETIVSRVLKGETALSPELAGLLREAVALLTRWHGGGEGGEPVGEADVVRLLDRLDGGDPQPTEEGEPVSPAPTAPTPPAGSPPPLAEPSAKLTVSRAASLAPSRQETVRTPVDRLDAILYRAEEMHGLREDGARNVKRTAALRARLTEWRNEWGKAQVDSGFVRHLAGEANLLDLPVEIRETMQRLYGFLDWNREFFEQLGDEIRELIQARTATHGRFEANVDRLLDETKELLMVPFSRESEKFAVFVAETARQALPPKKARLKVEGADVEIDRRILEAMKNPFIHLLRNAVDHSLEVEADREREGKPAEGTIRFSITPLGDGTVEVLVADDGRGIDVADLRERVVAAGLAGADQAATLPSSRLFDFMFEANFSTRTYVSETSGRGLGLAIVKETAERLGGYVSVSSEPGKGTAFRVVLPMSLARFRAVELRCGGRAFLLPSGKMRHAGRVKRSEIKYVEGKATIRSGPVTLPLFRLADVLGLVGEKAEERDYVAYVTVKERGMEFALEVDELVEEREAVMRSLGPQLRRVRHIAGASIGDSGRVVPVIHVADVGRTVAGGGGAAPARVAAPVRRREDRSKRILVVEDSMTARSLLKNILEGSGYRVGTARDGLDGLDLVRKGKFDLVLTDVEMPHLDGFELTREIRNDENLRDLPVIILTALASREDKERGMEAGADAYVVKSNFDQSDLLDTVKDLLRND